MPGPDVPKFSENPSDRPEPLDEQILRRGPMTIEELRRTQDAIRQEMKDILAKLPDPNDAKRFWELFAADNILQMVEVKKEKSS